MHCGLRLRHPSRLDLPAAVSLVPGELAQAPFLQQVRPAVSHLKDAVLSLKEKQQRQRGAGACSLLRGAVQRPVDSFHHHPETAFHRLPVHSGGHQGRQLFRPPLVQTPGGKAAGLLPLGHTAHTVRHCQEQEFPVVHTAPADQQAILIHRALIARMGDVSHFIAKSAHQSLPC